MTDEVDSAPCRPLSLMLYRRSRAPRQPSTTARSAYGVLMLSAGQIQVLRVIITTMRLFLVLTPVYRIRKARVLVLGVSGLTVEASKNLVLAGVHSLTLCDDKTKQIGELSLFAPAEPASNVRPSSLMRLTDTYECLQYIDHVCERLQLLNPLVAVTAIDSQQTASQLQHGEFFRQYDIVIMNTPTLSAMVYLEALYRAVLVSMLVKGPVAESCRRAGVKFFGGSVAGLTGYFFADLQHHAYIQ